MGSIKIQGSQGTQKPKGQKMLQKPNKKSCKKLVLQLFYSATFVETTPAAPTIVKFYEIAHPLPKTTSFIKKTTPLL